MPSALKISFFDAFGNPIDKTYEKNNITVITTVNNPTDRDCLTKLIAAFYKDGALMEVTYENALASINGTVTLLLEESVPTDADSIRAYAWTDGLIPLTPVSTIPIRPSYDKSADE